MRVLFRNVSASFRGWLAEAARACCIAFSLLLFAASVGEAMAQEGGKKNEGLSTQTAVKEGLGALKNFLEDATALEKMSDAQKVDFILNQAEKRILETATKAATDAAKSVIEDYARAQIRADTFWKIAAPRLKDAIARGEGVSNALWNQLEIERMPEIDNRVAAVAKGLTISVDLLQTWYNEGSEKAQKKALETVVDETAGRMIPGYDIFKAALGVVEALRDYVLGYAWETAREGIIKCMFEPDKDPAGFARWLLEQKPSDLRAKVKADWEVASQCRAVGPMFLGRATDEGEEKMQQDIVYALTAMRGNLARKEAATRNLYREASRRQAALAREAEVKKREYLAAVAQAGNKTKEGLQALARVKASLGGAERQDAEAKRRASAAPKPPAAAKPVAGTGSTPSPTPDSGTQLGLPAGDLPRCPPGTGPAVPMPGQLGTFYCPVPGAPQAPAPEYERFDPGHVSALMGEVLAFWSGNGWRNPARWAEIAQRHIDAAQYAGRAGTIASGMERSGDSKLERYKAQYDSARTTGARYGELNKEARNAMWRVLQDVGQSLGGITRDSRALTAEYGARLEQLIKKWAAIYDTFKVDRGHVDLLTRGEPTILRPNEDRRPGWLTEYRAARAEELARLKRAHAASEAALKEWQKLVSDYDNEVARLWARLDRVLPRSFWEIEAETPERELQDRFPASEVNFGTGGSLVHLNDIREVWRNWYVTLRLPIDRTKATLQIEDERAKLHPMYFAEAIETLELELALIEAPTEADFAMQRFVPRAKSLAEKVEKFYEALPAKGLIGSNIGPEEFFRKSGVRDITTSKIDGSDADMLLNAVKGAWPTLAAELTQLKRSVPATLNDYQKYYIGESPEKYLEALEYRAPAMDTLLANLERARSQAPEYLKREIEGTADTIRQTQEGFEQVESPASGRPDRDEALKFIGEQIKGFQAELSKGNVRFLPHKAAIDALAARHAKALAQPTISPEMLAAFERARREQARLYQPAAPSAGSAPGASRGPSSPSGGAGAAGEAMSKLDQIKARLEPILARPQWDAKAEDLIDEAEDVLADAGSIPGAERSRLQAAVDDLKRRVSERKVRGDRAQPGQAAVASLQPSAAAADPRAREAEQKIERALRQIGEIRERVTRLLAQPVYSDRAEDLLDDAGDLVEDTLAETKGVTTRSAIAGKEKLQAVVADIKQLIAKRKSEGDRPQSAASSAAGPVSLAAPSAVSPPAASSAADTRLCARSPGGCPSPEQTAEAVAKIIDPLVRSIEAMKAQARRDPAMAASYRSHARNRANDALRDVQRISPESVPAAKSKLEGVLSGL